ncbi:C40 family peptidase [Streptomyces olivaceus]|uniref:C40 family peptidase n=1 Tax=Streptomyces olivaceus TaxID=47716 RepID=A0ABS7VVK4_STROV|nr:MULTISPECIES: C40 family peptidase [Streptomyces]MBZ6079581.1 C40 family peptidase [Streptomyces olivaceus]MBZ6086879.1 C40 family peptidase [Streptomyces olivaceus]MBZ6094520.1 C40 family peptidase [Streptomyces olivaceus]MBZ6107101.1 C40 family peptidase [Streptomyces olivaceus]MBZ6108206.1 C40 family peptidase [Streptomyces olivaceus]
MSHTAHIRSHRKPRRSASTIAMRTGVAGGVLSTLAVAGASGSATAAEPVTQTLELPTLTADLAAQVAHSADVTQQAASSYELRAERDAAAAKAAKQAKADLAEAKKKAAEEKKKAEEAARKEAAERASRTAERTTLSASADTGSAASTGSSSVAPPASGSAAAIVSFVQAQVGKAYVSGATGPSAYDCSGLVQAAFNQVGISLPRVSQAQSTAGTQVGLDNLQPGDILYWGGAGSAYHVGVYVGDGMFVGAQNSSTGVVEKPLSYDPPSGAVRVL